MRPPGEIRKLITDTIKARGEPMPLRDIAAVTQIGYGTCRTTINNAVRAGVLEIVGHEKRAHCKQWVALYDVVRPGDMPQAVAAVAELQTALSQWR